MRNLLLTALAGASALTLAAPAFAQDTVERAPFSGVYVGGSASFDVQPNDVGERIEFDRNLDGNFGDTVTTAAGANAFSPGFCNGKANINTPALGCNNDKDHVGYYGRVGFDYQLPSNIVLGAVGEFGKSEISDRVSAFSTTPASYTMYRRIDWEAMIRGRAGYAANNTLFYGTAGLGYTRIKNSFTTTNTANSFTGINTKNNEFGLVAGGGLEQKITKNISIGLEYLFHRYKDTNYRVRVGQGTAPATNPFILAPNTTGTDLRRNYDYFRWHSMRAGRGVPLLIVARRSQDRDRRNS